ncbi:MAG: GNAT family N-acetyltransferase [Chloroflexota bacterium]
MPDPTPLTSPSLPQLRMEIGGLTSGRLSAESSSSPPASGAFGLRTFREGDQDAWLALLQSGDFGHWDRERLDLMLASQFVRVPRDGIFFATLDDRPVGTASTYLHQGDGGILAELGWVVVEPRHRGRGLGLVVCRAVLDFIARLGFDRAYLLTDDFRLPAIQTYFKLGFEPAVTHASHPARWQAIRAALARPPKP